MQIDIDFEFISNSQIHFSGFQSVMKSELTLSYQDSVAFGATCDHMLDRGLRYILNCLYVPYVIVFRTYNWSWCMWRERSVRLLIVL